MRPRVVVAIFATAAVLAIVALVIPGVRGQLTVLADPGATGSPTGTVSGHPGLRMAAQAAPPGPLLRAAPVTVTANGFFAWALLDRQTGALAGSANYTTETGTTESMSKAWITADYLRRLAGKQPTQQRLDELSRMIRDSDDAAAEDIYRLDGLNAVIQRMISTCGMTDTTWVNGWWSKTRLTARDAVRLGLCLADGRAAGPTWTSWLLNEMRQVRGEGRFGIIEALPADVAPNTSIKNGWTLLYDDGTWHVACLAVHADWILSVLTRYPASLGLAHGAAVCRSVTQQLTAKR